MIFSEQTSETDTRPDKIRTVEILTQIASRQDNNIQFTWDSPERNVDRRMPVLDLKLWVEKDSNGIQKVRHTFYKKEVASKYTILKRSALSWRTKKSILLQEAIRRICNVSPDLPWQETAGHLSE